MKQLEAPKISLFSSLRNYFLTGILVTVPVGLSLYVVYSVIVYVDNFIKYLFPPFIRNSWIISGIPGLGILIVSIVLIIIGALMAGYFGRAFFRAGENLVERMPIVRSLYGTTKQILQTMISSKGKSFDRVVLVEYPIKGSWALGFVTGNAPTDIYTDPSSEMLSVFIPTTPLPTQGFLIFVPAQSVKPLNMKVEKGLKTLLSLGMGQHENKEKL